MYKNRVFKRTIMSGRTTFRSGQRSAITLVNSITVAPVTQFISSTITNCGFCSYKMSPTVITIKLIFWNDFDWSAIISDFLHLCHLPNFLAHTWVCNNLVESGVEIASDVPFLVHSYFWVIHKNSTLLFGRIM